MHWASKASTAHDLQRSAWGSPIPMSWAFWELPCLDSVASLWIWICPSCLFCCGFSSWPSTQSNDRDKFRSTRLLGDSSSGMCCTTKSYSVRWSRICARQMGSSCDGSGEQSQLSSVCAFSAIPAGLCNESAAAATRVFDGFSTADATQVPPRCRARDNQVMQAIQVKANRRSMQNRRS